MRTRELVLGALGLLLSASTSLAGPITSTIGGASSTTIPVGSTALITVDNVITWGPTPVVGTLSVVLSFDATSVVSGGGAGPQGGTTVPLPDPWLDFTNGVFSCAASGFCDDILGGHNFGAANFLAGETSTIASVVIDPSGLAVGRYAVGVAFGPDDAILIAFDSIDLSGEYVPARATIRVVPEPGSGALLALGLAVIARGRRR